MRKSKHFRKDVIIARIIFAILCIVLGVLIGTGISAIVKSSGGKDDTKKPSTQTEEVQNESNKEDIGTQVVPDQEGEPEEDEGDTISYAVATSDLRIRQEPNTNCTVLAGVYSGTKMLLLEELDGWYKVSYEDQEGYVSADYVTIEKEQKTSSADSDYVIMLDPGHQLKGDSATEPNGPNSSEMKARVTSGATGVATGVDEYELTLEIGLLLRDELESRGYTVLMTRETHDVNISNMERAQKANDAGADITVRIHANSYGDDSVYGAETLAPSTGNAYVGNLAEDSQKLSQSVLQAYCEATGMHNRGVKIDDTMTGINWCEMPVTIIEMGFLSNPTDDTNMQDAAYQQKMVQGIADGIDAYFGL